MPEVHPYVIVNFDNISPVACPCGEARRAFADIAYFPGTLHRTTITDTAKTHYHKTLTETYYILECNSEAYLELDGSSVPVRSGTCVIIPPGVKHRAVGHMTVLILSLPKFDPADEFIVED
jgi:hypothetical protein